MQALPKNSEVLVLSAQYFQDLIDGLVRKAISSTGGQRTVHLSVIHRSQVTQAFVSAFLTCSLNTGYLVKRAVGHIIDIFQHACVTASATASTSASTSASADGVLASASAALPLSFTLFIPEHIWIGVIIACAFPHVVDAYASCFLLTVVSRCKHQ